MNRIKIENLSRVLCLDFGLKRTGIAVSDTLKMIANPHAYVFTNELLQWLEDYYKIEKVEILVLGRPIRMHGEPSEIEQNILLFIEVLRGKFPSLIIDRHDERFSSKMAQQAMITGGMKKNKRREKGKIDEIAATIILQDYLDLLSKRKSNLTK